MTLHIIDPNLVHEHGHHLDWDLAIGAAAERRGQKVVIFSHRDFPKNQVSGAKIIPHFSHTTYETRHADPVAGRLDDFTYFNERLAEELNALGGYFRPNDLALAPTASENHILGYVNWIKTFDPMLAPLFVLHLMFPSGIALAADGRFAVVDELRAALYKVSLREILGDFPHARVFGGGRQIAREYSALSGVDIPPHAVPFAPVRSRPLPQGPRRAALLFAGDAKVDKGIVLLADLIPRLCAENPDWDFLVHLNGSASWGLAEDACKLIVGMKDRFANLRLQTGRLERDAYLALFEDAQCMVSTYDPVAYARKSSGVVWESISLGAPMLLPENTWLAKEALEWGAGHATYSAPSADSIASAFPAFAARMDEMLAQSKAAALLYRRFNGADMVIDQVVEPWVRRFMAASMIAEPEPRILPLADIVGFGWREVENDHGNLVRWTGREFSLEFDWKYPRAWEIELLVESYGGENRLEGARAFCAGRPRALEHKLDGRNGASLTVQGLAGRRDPSRQVLLISLPEASAPSDEKRDLGVRVKRIVLRASAGARRSAEAQTLVEVLSPVEWRAGGLAFRLADAASGFAVVDTQIPAKFNFDVETDASPVIVRSLRLFVNGFPVFLELFADGGGRWRAAAYCEPEILAGAGARVEFDLVLEQSDAERPVWIGDLRVSDVAATPRSTFVETAAPSPAAPPPPASAAPADIAPPSPPESEPGRANVLLSTSMSGDILVAESIRLDQHFASATYQHLDISILRATLRSAAWPHLKFKFCLGRRGRLIEFRKREDWPEMFEQWPESEEDQFGLVLHLDESADAKAAIAEWRSPRDRLLLEFVAMALPDVVETAGVAGALSAAEIEMWKGEAALISDFYRTALSERELGASGARLELAETETP